MTTSRVADQEPHQTIDLVSAFRHGLGCRVIGDEELVRTGNVKIGGVARNTLFVHPPAAISIHLPRSTRSFRTWVAIDPEAWEMDTGPCEFRVEADGQTLIRRTIDVVGRKSDRRWHALHVDLQESERPFVDLRLQTRGIDGDSYRWALFGDPKVVAAGHFPEWDLSVATALHEPIDRRTLEQLAIHPENLSFNLYRELMYWNNTIRSGENPYILERMDEETLGRSACPDFILNAVEQETTRLGRTPRVLDFGSGPFSTLIYLKKAGLADVTCADTLSEEYRTLLEAHQIAWPLIPEKANGEFLVEKYGEEAFDLVFVSNALDHTQAPALTWMNLFQVTRTGGVLAHRHAIREATHENWDQLHQFDLFPNNASLQITDARGMEFSLTDELPIHAEFQREFELAGFDWFETAYRKTGKDVLSSRFLKHALTQLGSAYRNRSRQAFRLEHAIADSQDMSDRFNGLPFYLDPDRD